ncbi:MAG TPA: hypothetical protein VIX80_06340 [Candidatus Kapabacteria bacterium]
MKAETLLTLMKKCVLCLFLCTISKAALSQQVDTSLVSKAVTNQIMEIYRSHRNLKIRGDSSIISYIPSYIRYHADENDLARDTRIVLWELRTSTKDKYISIDLMSSIVDGDQAFTSKESYLIDADSLKTHYVAPIYPEEDSFWDDTLQPILVTAGAAAVIALFFFVKF